MPQAQVSKLFSSPKKPPFPGPGGDGKNFFHYIEFQGSKIPLGPTGLDPVMPAPLETVQGHTDHPCTPHFHLVDLERSWGNLAQHLPWHTPSPAHTEIAYW